MSVARTLRGRLLCPRPEQARVELVPDGLDEIDAQDSKNGNKALDDRIRNLEQRAAGMLTEAAAKIEALSRRVDEAS